jgi:hypothetical protein
MRPGNVQMLWLVAFCVLGLSSGLTVAQRRAPSAASQLLAGAAQAMGGEEKLRSLTGVELSGVSVWHQREQSERPEGPWVATFTEFTDVRNLRADAVLRSGRTRGWSAPDWVDNSNWSEEPAILVANDVALRRANGALAPASVPWDLGALPVSLGPEHVIVAARDAADVRVEADERLDGYAHHVVAFTFAGAHVRLFLNVPSLLPKAVEITRARPYDIFWAPWGDVTQRITFGIWTLEPEGVRYPRLWEFSTNGQSDGTIEITHVRLNPAIVAAEFDVAADDRERLIVNRRRVADLPFGASRRQVHELAPGVVKVPGNWDVVEVKQEDGIVILEGPMSSEYSIKAIDDARQRLGGAPIKAVISTSDAWPHIGGMREYVARRIPMYVLDLNVPILTRLFAAKYESFPDALARTARRPIMHVVSGRTIVGSGANRLEIYPFRTASGERQMMVYWPAHQLLYTSDLFAIGDGQVFLPQQVAEAVEAVARERLAIATAFGMHYDALPWATVVKSAAPPLRASGSNARRS